jgi:hypothetical protein
MANEADEEKVCGKVREYEKKYRNPNLEKLEISNLYHIPTQWNEVFPFSNENGCYVFYSCDKQLLYVGKASLKHALGARIGSYFRQGVPVHNGWSHFPEYLQTIKVQFAFEAPSLEEFLITELTPPDNTLK